MKPNKIEENMNCPDVIQLWSYVVVRLNAHFPTRRSAKATSVLIRGVEKRGVITRVNSPLTSSRRLPAGEVGLKVRAHGAAVLRRGCPTAAERM